MRPGSASQSSVWVRVVLTSQRQQDLVYADLFILLSHIMI